MRSENTFLLARAGLVVTQVRERVASSLSCIAQTCMDWVWTSEHSIKEIIISKYRSSLYWICFGKWRVWSEGKERKDTDASQTSQEISWLIFFVCFSLLLGNSSVLPHPAWEGRGEITMTKCDRVLVRRGESYHWTISDLVGGPPWQPCQPCPPGST